jgi:hypothetical protein
MTERPHKVVGKGYTRKSDQHTLEERGRLTSAGGGGELRALRAGDVNWPAATEIRVSRGWDDVEAEIGPKARRVGALSRCPPRCAGHLLAHKLAGRRDGDDFLFGRTAREPFTPTHIRKQALAAWAAKYTCGCEIEADEDEQPPDLCRPATN